MLNEKMIIKPKIIIKVFGVGGGGNSTIERVSDEQRDVDISLIGVNSDVRQLSRLMDKGIDIIAIGDKATAGRGTGGKVEVGEQAALRDERSLRAAMEGADLVIITATLGGGLGTGAAPVLAKIAREMNILSLGVVTTPFKFEGSYKNRVAGEGIIKLQALMDAIIIINNDNLMKTIESRKVTLSNAFNTADTVLKQTIACIAEVILTTGTVNVDFADIKTILRQSDSSDAMLAIGVDDTPLKAVLKAIEGPLIDRDVKGARGIVVNITGDERLPLYDVYEAMQYIYSNSHVNANIIMGTVTDNSMAGKVKATIIATDFEDSVSISSPKAEKTTTNVNETMIAVDTPSFMQGKPTVIQGSPKPDSRGQDFFAIPAFKLTPDK